MKRIKAAGKRPFQFTIITALQFVIVTIIAMFFYGGGTHSDPSNPGYSFTRNFFSSLGLFVAPNGEANTVSAVLFFIAMSLAGFGLVVYFIFAPQFFWGKGYLRALCILGSLFGIFSGICFMGVAFTPADVFPDAHGWFVWNAFRTFLVAVIFYAAAILLTRGYPKRYALVYGLFALLLAAYIWLMISGPAFGTSDGEMVQATGQKIIGYASIICMSIQAYGSVRLIEAGSNT